jgi:flagellar hook-basal body complex protein FliE
MTAAIGYPEKFGVILKPEQTAPAPGPAPKTQEQHELVGPTFSDHVADFVAGTNRLQQGAQYKAEEFAVGHQNDIHGTMIATEQAEISLHLLANVRNRVVDLYREVMRMGS